MTVASFLETFPRTGEHSAFGKTLWPVAPEYATGEVLLGGAYRKLLLGVRDADVDLERIEHLPAEHGLAPETLWRDLLLRPDGLASPAPRGRRQGGRLRQLMPLVPSIARHALVLGRRRNRWESGNLLLAAMAAGIDPERWAASVENLRAALAVTESDDIFSRFVEASLAEDSPRDEIPELQPPKAPWRVPTARLIPAERFGRDLEALGAVKPGLTRRHYMALVEACIRMGLALHVFWLLGLSWQIWRLAERAVVDGSIPSEADVTSAWEHHHLEPMLVVGGDASSVIRRFTQRFVLARIGLNLILHSLHEAGTPWESELGTAHGDVTPQQAVRDFLEHVAVNRTGIDGALRASNVPGISRGVANAADSRVALLEARSGFSKNISEFLRYALGQLQPDEQELAAYDQGYLLRRRTAAANSTLLTDPGPAMLLFLVYACSYGAGTRAPSVDAFRSYMRSWGIHIPAGEFTDGSMVGNMERLGLVIESPDAGGGRLLFRPF